MGQAAVNTFNHAAEVFISLHVLSAPPTAAASAGSKYSSQLMKYQKERLYLMRQSDAFQTTAWCNNGD